MFWQWDLTTTQNLAIHASNGYPFLFSILGCYVVCVYYIKDSIHRTTKVPVSGSGSGPGPIHTTELRETLTNMKHATELRKTLDCIFYYWNIGLALFSLFGAINLYPELTRKIVQNTYRDFWCESIVHYYPTTLEWLSYFHLSKFVELGDTLFLVLRGKEAPFLHIYHHITVAAISWGSIETMPSHILTGAFINYSIHSIMYLYFALHLYGKIPTWFRSYWITYIQILQMVIGIYGSIETYYYITDESAGGMVSVQDGICQIEPTTATTAAWEVYSYVGYYSDLTQVPATCGSTQGFVAAGLGLYASYLWLFIDFYRKKTQ